MNINSFGGFRLVNESIASTEGKKSEKGSLFVFLVHWFDFFSGWWGSEIGVSGRNIPGAYPILKVILSFIILQDKTGNSCREKILLSADSLALFV
jgi:hypothetical protein